MTQKFSVLISVYSKVDSQQFSEAMDSIINQTIVPDEIVLVEDGPLTDALYNEILLFKNKFPNLVTVKLAVNQGLGLALKIGLERCTYNLVARMDTDDISVKNRFEIQLETFLKKPNTSVVGGQIAEFYDDEDQIINYRNVPLEQKNILTMLKRRNPVNHVTVMFKKDEILKVGGYKDLPYLEDYYLWCRLLVNNNIIMNIDCNLVKVRTGADMYKRRGNKDYIESWKELQSYMKKNGLINKFDYIVNIINIYIFINIPPRLKETIYSKFLRVQN